MELNVSTGHNLHEAEPGSSEYFPTSHALQSALLCPFSSIISEYMPEKGNEKGRNKKKKERRKKKEKQQTTTTTTTTTITKRIFFFLGNFQSTISQH